MIVSRKGAKKAKAQRDVSLCAFAFFAPLRETSCLSVQYFFLSCGFMPEISLICWL